MFDYFDDFLSFFYYVSEYIIVFILDHKVVFSFFLVPIVAATLFVVIDFIFDVRDSFSDFNSFKDYFRYSKYKFYYSTHKKKKQLDMEEIYQRSRQNTDYKHNLRMQEMKYFRENEEIRHGHKHEENEMFLNRNSIPKHNDKKKVNLDIEVED
ncbi:MAG: hypothetical protein J1E36_03850 [Eubacterium sp.]|nr:hypothetical protein [Eubacterium sp.]